MICWVLAAVVAMLLPMGTSAQTSSINAYSPYSMYGPGELLMPGTVQMRSMGGVGIGMRALGQINMLNPASASIAPSKSFLFDLGFDATHFRNSQPKYNASGDVTTTARTAYNTVNIHSLALAFPIAKGVGATFSIAPYSSVGYKVKTTDEQQNNWADIGRVMYGHDGDGDISEVKLALGWAPWKNFSIGVAAKYYWGNIERNYLTEISNVVTGSGTYSSTRGVDYYRVSNFKFQVGVQWDIIASNDRLMTLGATYDLGGRLNPTKQSYIYTDNTINSIQSFPVRDRIETVELRVPHQVGAGLYYRDRVVAWGVDYIYADWGSSNDSYAEGIAGGELVVDYADTHTVRAGFEITPRRSDVRNYFNRISYRVGVGYGNYYQTFAGERINKLSVTAGLGLPVKVWGASSINIGFEYGRMSAPGTVDMSGMKVGLVTQNYYKLTIGFSLFSADTSDYWFVRQKYD